MAIPLCLTNQRDVLIWPGCSNGEYSVKSSYKQLCEEENSSDASASDGSLQKAFWKRIWKIRVPNKIKTFLWRVCFDALPTKVNLKKRKILEDTQCGACLSAQETTLHAIWSCEELKEIWLPCFSWVRAEYPNISEVQELINLVGMQK